MNGGISMTLPSISEDDEEEEEEEEEETELLSPNNQSPPPGPGSGQGNGKPGIPVSATLTPSSLAPESKPGVPR